MDIATFKRYFRSTRPFWKYIYTAFLMMLIMTAVAMTLPRLFKYIIDDYLPQKDFTSLIHACLVVMALYLLRMGAFILRNNQMLKFGYYYIYDLRSRLMHHFQLLSFRFYDRVKTGDIMNRMLDDVMNTEMMTTNSLIYLLEDLFLLTGVGTILFFINPKLAVIAIFVIPIYGFIHRKFQRKIGKLNKDIRHNYALLASEFHDSIAGVKEVKAFTLEDYKKKALDKYLVEDRHLRIKTYTINALFVSLTEYITIIGILVVLIGGGYYSIVTGTMTAGDIVSFYTYLGYLYQPLVRLSNTTTVIEAGMSSIRRIFEVLDTTASPPEKPGAIQPLHKSRGHVVFENVSFAYHSSARSALSNVSMDVNPGKSIALVGPSGAGKSTIINLLLRFYDPDQGTIWLDGYNLRDLKLNWLRKNMAIVLQDGFLFWGTIGENIRYGNIDATDQQVMEAAKLAYAYDFIMKLPRGFDTNLGERGVGLSGGQKQRIAIARAILKNAPIMILDEATSALDTESEYKIQKAIKKLMEERTTFVIAHRLSTIQNADEIFVIQNGEIVETGNHIQLLNKEGLYYTLHNARPLRVDENN